MIWHIHEVYYVEDVYKVSFWGKRRKLTQLFSFVDFTKIRERLIIDEYGKDWFLENQGIITYLNGTWLLIKRKRKMP